MTTTTDPSLDTALTKFLAHLIGKNRSDGTIQAYATDLNQFLTHLTENDLTVHSPMDITKSHISEYLTYLSRERGLSCVTCSRKLAAIREYFRFLVDGEVITKSPAERVESPKQERRSRNRMRQDEYNRLLSVAGSNHRDYAILTVLLQCGLRVSELYSLTVDDIDLSAGVLLIRDGKGQADRRIAPEKKTRKALTAFLKDRGEQDSSTLSLNRYGEPLSRYGVRKLILRLCTETGLEKKVRPHIFRHIFASMRACLVIHEALFASRRTSKRMNATSIMLSLVCTFPS
jgi:site-specific recombinase XerD